MRVVVGVLLVVLLQAAMAPSAYADEVNCMVEGVSQSSNDIWGKFYYSRVDLCELDKGGDEIAKIANFDLTETWVQFNMFRDLTASACKVARTNEFPDCLGGTSHQAEWLYTNEYLIGYWPDQKNPSLMVEIECSTETDKDLEPILLMPPMADIFRGAVVKFKHPAGCSSYMETGLTPLAYITLVLFVCMCCVIIPVTFVLCTLLCVAGGCCLCISGTGGGAMAARRAFRGRGAPSENTSMVTPLMDDMTPADGDFGDIGHDTATKPAQES